MVTTTLKCLVLKTVTVGGVKLPTPADRIGTGAMVDLVPPANSLSRGLFFQPQLPTRNRVGLRQFTAMRYEPTTVVPTSSVGSFSGPSACRRSAVTAAKHADWADHPWSPSAHPRLGRDCQSPDRSDARRDRAARTARTVGLAATAARK